MLHYTDIAIIGGGCYGSFYLGQLLKARSAGALDWQRVLVVDRDAACQAAGAIATVDGVELVVAEWGAFLDDWLDRDLRTDHDQLVPSPLMPHLMAEWLTRRAAEHWPAHRVGMVPASAPAGTPFDALHPGDGVRYMSHADWVCPVHSIEPATSPMIKAPRGREMSDHPTAGPALFVCRHVSHGVGMYPITGAFAALDALDAVVRREGRGDLVIGSVSACHGAAAVLRVER